MSGYTEGTGFNQDQFWSSNQNQDSSYSFDVPSNQFGQELNFQSFSDPASGQQEGAYSGAPLYGSNPYLDPNASSGYGGEMFSPSQDYGGENGGEFDGEPPLLEELGINPDHIMQKTLSVLNPFRTTDASVLQDADMAGPLVFCFAFGGFLLLSGKMHFSYIYGIGVMGCLAMYALLSLMAASGVTIGGVVSVLGYCLLPMVALAGVNVLLSLQGVLGIVLTSVAIGWCSLSASKLLVTALGMRHQQPLVAYPCALLYGVFALITIF